MNHMHKGLPAQDPRRRYGTGAIWPARRKVTIDELIAIGNRDDAALKPYAERLTDAPSPIVATAARWAVERLGALDG